MATLGYSLLKRNPVMTREEFSHHWEKKHAPIVIPWALQYGVEYYAQIHHVRLAPDAPPQEDLDIEEWDGAAQMKMPDPERMAQAFTDPYYLNVILQDERRFLVSEAKQHIKVVPLGTIAGDKRIIIDSRKAIVDDREAQDVQREALRVWREYQGHEKITSRLVLTAGPNEDNGEVKMQLDQLTEWTPKEETGRKVDGD